MKNVFHNAPKWWLEWAGPDSRSAFTRRISQPAGAWISWNTILAWWSANILGTNISAWRVVVPGMSIEDHQTRIIFLTRYVQVQAWVAIRWCYLCTDRMLSPCTLRSARWSGPSTAASIPRCHGKRKLYPSLFRWWFLCAISNGKFVLNSSVVMNPRSRSSKRTKSFQNTNPCTLSVPTDPFSCNLRCCLAAGNSFVYILLLRLPMNLV